MDVLDLFLQLVKIPSPLYKVGAIQEFLKGIFNNYPKAEIIMDEAGSEHPDFEAGNMLINIPATIGYEHLPVLAVEAHVDTVKEDNPIEPIVHLKKVTSDGTTILGADDKAGVAAICIAMELLKDSSHGPIQIIFSVGEEASMYGMSGFDFKKIEAKQILCIDGFEPTHIINACAGKIKYRALFIGKEAHGAEPEKANNAIALASVAIADCILRGLMDRTKSGVIHNVAEIQSHEGPSDFPSNNTIPGACSVSGELRGLDKVSLNESFKKIQKTMHQAVEDFNGSVNFEILIPYEPFNLVNSEIVQRLIKKNPDKDFKTESCDGSTHANIYNQYGIESVVIGAGCRNPHAKNEYLVIAELREVTEIILNYLKA